MARPWQTLEGIAWAVWRRPSARGMRGLPSRGPASLADVELFFRGAIGLLVSRGSRPRSPRASAPGRQAPRIGRSRPVPTFEGTAADRDRPRLIAGWPALQAGTSAASARSSTCRNSRKRRLPLPQQVDTRRSGLACSLVGKRRIQGRQHMAVVGVVSYRQGHRDWWHQADRIKAVLLAQGPARVRCRRSWRSHTRRWWAPNGR